MDLPRQHNQLLPQALAKLPRLGALSQTNSYLEFRFVQVETSHQLLEFDVDGGHLLRQCGLLDRDFLLRVRW